MNKTNFENRYSKRHDSTFLWPKEDVWAWKWLYKKDHWDLPNKISTLCKNKETVIQAGGNAGLYPLLYSKIFNTVITCEPDLDNYYCLTQNVLSDNVIKYPYALGSNIGLVGLTTNPLWDIQNSGALKVKESGNIKQVTIDSLNVRPDLIHLDIEGFEGPALVGAETTINNYTPLIVLETNGSGDEYGWPQPKINNLLKSWGYSVYLNWGHDTVYKHENY
jgi:FkbM family methyltransferase